MGKGSPLLILSIFFCFCQNPESLNNSSSENDSTLDLMDAVLAAPNSHQVLIDNDKVRVLRVKIKPGEKEPMHNHNWESVMYVDHPAMIKYFNENGDLVFESDKEKFSYTVGDPSWMKAEGIHAVENIDTIEFSAIRIEIKD